MYKVVILILSLVCGVRAGKAVEALPETTVASSFQLYQELGLRGEVNFPAFEQALKGFSRYASGQDRLLDRLYQTFHGEAVLYFRSFAKKTFTEYLCGSWQRKWG